METTLFSFPTPFTPPTTEEDKLSWLRLIRSRRVGPTTFWRLLDENGSAQSALEALPQVAGAAGVRDYSVCLEGVALSEMRLAKRIGARLICRGDATYPASLAEISDAPPLFWALGDISLLSRPMVALVGGRNASSLGTRMARKLAEGLVEAGYTVVSGLARGIDAAAHTAALPATIAVQAGGVDVIYPIENASLAAEIAAKGLRLSEQPVGLQPTAHHFPIRNRIISGLARCVVVVEAAARSGSLLTARNALDQGREVMAVPGHPFDARASGCNMLIRDGAVLVRGTVDVLTALAGFAQAAPAKALLEPPAPSPTAPAQRGLRAAAALHNLILNRLSPTPLAVDQLIRDLARPAAEITEELLSLELDGQITRAPGGMIARAN